MEEEACDGEAEGEEEAVDVKDENGLLAVDDRCNSCGVG